MTSPATILLGPAAGGKTQRLVELLVGDAMSTQPRWAVLPDRMQVSAFRRRIAQAGGALGVSVGTFGDLFQEMLARAGRPLAITPQPARQRILRLALRQLSADGNLPSYEPIVSTPGFLEAVGDAIAELKRARVGPQQVGALERVHLSEIAKIYAAYQERLEAIPWTDREGLTDLAIEALAEHPELVADMSLIAVDGFDSFDNAQLEALRALAEQVERLVVSLPGSPQMERAAYRRFADPLQRLRQALPQATIEATKAPETLPEPLRHLELHLYEQDAGPAASKGAIEMIEARGPAEEAREAVRWIKARLVRERIGLEECAVIAPDPAGYASLLRRAANEFDVRLRFSQGESLNRAPAISALLDLLELSRSDWPRRLTLQTIRSPYLDLTSWGLGPSDALALDAASHAGQVVEGLDQWEHALNQLAHADPETWPGREESEVAVFSPPKGEAADHLLQGLRALAARLTPTENRTTSGWVEWLEDLLDEIDFEARTSDDRDHPAFLRLRETLRALVLGEFVAGGNPHPYSAFLDELRTAFEAARYREDRPLYEPAVNVLRLLEARGARYRAVVVLGLSEGLLPKIEREDPFLDEAAREALGLESRLGRKQGGLFYQAVTRADARLLLTRPYLADDGEAWEPSPFWHAAARLLDQRPRRIRPEDARTLADAGSPEELLFWGVRRGGMPASLAEAHAARWQELQYARDVLSARNQPQPDGPYEGDLADLAAELETRFGPDHLWSPSRLESYGNCPYMFFTAYLLGLETREAPDLGLDAAQLGSILHEALEAAYREAEHPPDAESVLRALDRELEPILDRAPDVYGFRPTPLWVIERQQYAEALRDTVTALAEQGDDWTPIGLELRFGGNGEAPLTLDLPGRTVRLRGIIDRLDRREGGELRVIDYKTGSGRLNVRELEQGRRIQLPLYALAAQEALGLGQVVEGFYWAILAAKRSTLRLSNYREPGENGEAGPPVAYDTTRGHVARIVNGVSAGQYPPEPPPGGCPRYCPAAAWCWRYQPTGWG